MRPRHQWGIKRVFLHTSDIADIGDATIDLVYSVAVAQHLTDSVLEHVLDTLRRKLKPAGRLLLHIVLDAEGWRTEEEWRRDVSIAGRLKLKYGLNCFTRSEKRVREMLEAAGFGSIVVQPMRDLCPEPFDDVCTQHLVCATTWTRMLRIIPGDRHDLFDLATTLLEPEVAAATPRSRQMHVVVKPNWVQHRAESSDSWDALITSPDLVVQVVRAVAALTGGRALVSVCDAPHTYADFDAILARGDLRQRLARVAAEWPDASTGDPRPAARALGSSTTASSYDESPTPRIRAATRRSISAREAVCIGTAARAASTERTTTAMASTPSSRRSARVPAGRHAARGGPLHQPPEAQDAPQDRDHGRAQEPGRHQRRQELAAASHRRMSGRRRRRAPVARLGRLGRDASQAARPGRHAEGARARRTALPVGAPAGTPSARRRWPDHSQRELAGQ